MTTHESHSNGTKKHPNVFPETNSRQKNHHSHGHGEKKDNLHRDMKREYELLQQYILNFNGSSF